MVVSERFKKELIVLLICILVSSVTAVEKPTSRQESCVTEQCHNDYSKKAYVHAPESLGDCKSCHEPNDVTKHTYEPSRKGSDLCEYCHLDQTTNKNIHDPLKDGDCMQCHEYHNSDNKFFLKGKNVADLCNDCHEADEGLKYLHGPTAVGECTICHDAHSSDHEKLLVAESSELCFSCHTMTKDELNEFEFVHEPAKNDCIGCHSGHGANNPMMLKAESPELCYPCHEDIKQIAETSKYQHKAIHEKGGCLKCHTPHASSVKYGLKADPLTLCMSCHDKPIAMAEDKTLEPFTNEIEDKKFMHGPVEQKDCKGCHLTHGSQHFRFLEKEYPPRFYAPFSKESYSLCFSCHPESLVLTKQTLELTDFRNGDSNLHFLHVNKPQRGRTCRSCHATHASNLPKHIRKSVPYGTWELPIQFEKTETGGSCKPGCHLPFAYDRKSPVVYEQTQSAKATVKP